MLNRKKLVVEQALSLFVEKGVAKTSIQDIIERSGISKGTFYNYFSSKTECIEAILEHARYDATLMRSELMIGKDTRDLDVLGDQVAVLSNINRKRGLDVLFEELLHLGDIELKKLVLKHRMLEFEWFSTRIIEIYGEESRDISFEVAILYYGMTYNLTFISKLISQNSSSKSYTSSKPLLYLNNIVESLIKENTVALDKEKLNVFRALYNKQFPISLNDIDEKLHQFTQSNFTKAQLQIINAVQEEIHRTPLRKVVLNALLKALVEEFNSSDFEKDAKEISSIIWFYVRNDTKKK